MLKQYHRFLQRNRNRGISNLMLYLCLANAVMYLYILFTQDLRPVDFMQFDAHAIMQGEVWRLFTWIFTRGANFVGEPLGILYIFFYVTFNRWLGSVLESVWGTLRLNLYYFGGALITVLGAMVIWWVARLPVSISAYFLELSLFLAVATLIPEERILLFGVFPIKMRWMAYLNVGLIALSILRTVTVFGGFLTGKILLMITYAPLISLLNYALNFGRDIANLLPRHRSFQQRKRHNEFKRAAQPNPDWAKNYRSSTGERPYRHKCTVCGRTDTENPGLEFRYCSRCKGYFCYCIDHINQHTHVE